VADATGTDHVATPGAGAAGGTGFGALALLDAEIRPGIELVLEMTDFARRVTGADLVITGEGSLDEQSLAGKAPIGVATAAGRAGVPVVAVAGRTELTGERLKAAGIAAAYPLSALEPDVARSIANAAELLGEVGRQIGTEWLRD
jgi:glycerate kinase